MSESARRTVVMDPELFERQLGYMLERVDGVSDRVEALSQSMRSEVSQGVQDGIRALADDTDFGALLGRRMFDELSNHAANAGSQWVGRRIITMMVLAVVGAGIAWLVKSGAIK